MARKDLVVKSLTIAQSAFVSETFDVTGVRLIGIWVPVVTSGQLFLKGSFDTTSANFVRVMDQNASPIASHWFANVGPGSIAVAFDLAASPFPFCRLETSVAQAAAVNPVVMCKQVPY